MLYTLDDSITVNYPVVRNIYVENVTSKSSKFGVRILGLDEEHQVSSVHLKNCVFNGVESGNDIHLIEELMVENVLINGEPWNR